AGKIDGTTFSLDEKKPLGISLPNLAIDKAGERVLDREDITGTIAGSVSTGDVLKAHFTALEFKSKNNLFNISKSDGPLDVALGTGIQGNGEIKLSADVRRLMDVAGQPKSGSGRIDKGDFDGTLKFATDQTKGTDIGLDGRVKNLNVQTTGKPLVNETIT